MGAVHSPMEARRGRQAVGVGPNSRSDVSGEGAALGVASGIAFLVIFPGFIAYQTAVDAGLFPPLLGGFFSAACIGMLPVALYQYGRSLAKVGLAHSYTASLYAGFLVLFGTAIYGGMLRGADEEIVGSHAAYLMKSIVLFLIGRTIDPENRRLQRLASLAFVLICFATLGRIAQGGFLEAEFARQVNAEFQLDYQGVAHAFLVLAIFCIPVRTGWTRGAMYAVSMPVLFLMGARSEIVAFVLAAILIELCNAKARLRYLIFVLASATILIAGLWVAADALPDHRVFNLIKIGSDISAQERGDLSLAAWQTIKDSPFFGAYASYEGGHYAHNVLSAWVDLGLAGFLLVLLVLALPLAVVLRQLRRDGRSATYAILLAALAASALLILFAKTYHYQLLPLALGLFVQRHIVRSRKRLRIKFV